MELCTRLARLALLVLRVTDVMKASVQKEDVHQQPQELAVDHILPVIVVNVHSTMESGKGKVGAMETVAGKIINVLPSNIFNMNLVNFNNSLGG